MYKSHIYHYIYSDVQYSSHLYKKASASVKDTRDDPLVTAFHWTGNYHFSVVLNYIADDCR